MSAFRHWPAVMGVAYFLVGCGPSPPVELSSSSAALSATSSSDSSSTAAAGSATTTPGATNPTGTATLTWDAPTVNTNGSVLDDLAGYHIYYGLSETQLSHEIVLNSASQTTYSIDDLAPGTYYFVVTAVNSLGAEGVQSNMVSKTI